jgi:prepilin-type N-terminal cleavage/methylation domain-containing protein
MITHRNRGFSAIEVIVVAAIVSAIAYAGWYAYQKNHKSTTASSSVQARYSTSKPPVPAKGMYLGAWVNPGQGTGIGGGSNTGAPGSNELSKLAAFNASIGKPVSILHVWSGFKTAVPTAELNAVSQNGSIPMINWGCTDVASISSGAQDATINAYAQGLKSYAKPVFLRWYWEFNQMSPAGKTPAGSGCNGYNNGPGFIAAWQHIYSLFHTDGVSNVAFVWCPGDSGGNFAAYYPGDGYVDWIGIDRYERTKGGKTALSFSDMFSSYYSEWAPHNKPIMIAETAAMGATDQSTYLGSMEAQAPQFSGIKAIAYFDSIGPAGDWSLTGSGLIAFKKLANDPYFSFTGR